MLNVKIPYEVGSDVRWRPVAKTEIQKEREAQERGLRVFWRRFYGERRVGPRF